MVVVSPYLMGEALLPGVVSLLPLVPVKAEPSRTFKHAGDLIYPAAGHGTVVLAKRIFHPRRSKCFHKGVS